MNKYQQILYSKIAARLLLVLLIWKLLNLLYYMYFCAFVLGSV